jgi:hypothetical protein
MLIGIYLCNQRHLFNSFCGIPHPLRSRVGMDSKQKIRGSTPLFFVISFQVNAKILEPPDFVVVMFAHSLFWATLFHAQKF